MARTSEDGRARRVRPRTSSLEDGSARMTHAFELPALEHGRTDGRASRLEDLLRDGIEDGRARGRPELDSRTEGLTDGGRRRPRASRTDITSDNSIIFEDMSLLLTMTLFLEIALRHRPRRCTAASSPRRLFARRTRLFDEPATYPKVSRAVVSKDACFGEVAAAAEVSRATVLKDAFSDKASTAAKFSRAVEPEGA